MFSWKQSKMLLSVSRLISSMSPVHGSMVDSQSPQLGPRRLPDPRPLSQPLPKATGRSTYYLEEEEPQKKTKFYFINFLCVVFVVVS